jgi:hypothetical protein
MRLYCPALDVKITITSDTDSAPAQFDVGSGTDVSEVHATYNFMIKCGRHCPSVGKTQQLNHINIKPT